MKNNKGFTLIELLSVLALLAIIMLIAVPNVISTIDKNRKDIMLNDAKRLVAITQYKAAFDSSLLPTVSTPTKTIFLNTLWGMNIGDIKMDPDDGEYNGTKSYVKIVLSSNNYVYSVKLCGSKRRINETNENDLIGNNIVVDGVCP